MSRELQAALAAAIDQDNVDTVFFVTLDVDSGPERLHSRLGTLSWGGNDYVGVGSMAQVGTVEEGTELSPYAIRLGLSGVDANILAIALNEDYMNRPCAVHFGVVDETDKLVSDPAAIHLGFISSADAAVGEAAGDDGIGDAVAITSESELKKFERASGARYTEAQLQAEHPGDLGLQYLDQIVDAKVVWRGKAALGGTSQPNRATARSVVRQFQL